jgi:hypothetical protein
LRLGAEPVLQLFEMAASSQTVSRRFAPCRLTEG